MRAGGLLALLILSCALHRPASPAAGPAAVVAPPQAPAPSPPPAPTLADRASRVLDQGLASGDLPVRGEALAALGASRRSGALPLLGKALDDDQGELRFAAAQGLAALGDPTASPLLLRAWKGEKGWAVKRELARAAAACGAKELLPELRLATSDGHPELAVAAAQALKALGDPAAEALLARLGAPAQAPSRPEGADRWSRRVLAGEREGSRALAARTLLDLGDAQDLPALEPLLASDAAPERLWAAAAILRLGR
jgi:HEAT repeat protein